MSKHTPGPWVHRNGRIFSADNEVLTIANVARAFDGDYSPSNGDLIAASPRLLAALKAAVDDIEMLLFAANQLCWQTDNEKATVKRAKAAIAAATGEQS